MVVLKIATKVSVRETVHTKGLICSLFFIFFSKNQEGKSKEKEGGKR